MNNPKGNGHLAQARRKMIASDQEPKLVSTVYCLWHENEKNPGDYDEKLLGFYSTREAAELARERLSLAPGFRDCVDGFVIDGYGLDQDHWTRGYVTVCPILVPTKNGEQVVAGAVALPGNIFEITDFDNDVDLSQAIYAPGQKVTCQELSDGGLVAVSLSEPQAEQD